MCGKACALYSWGGSGDRKHVKPVMRKETPQYTQTVLNPVLSHLVSRLGTVFY